MIPPPVLDDLPARAGPSKGSAEVAVLAGGCFWGVQAVYQRVHGVSQAVSGYAGGTAATARYEAVGSGSTGHAEAVRITYDPRQVSYGRLLQIFFSVAHDPTQLDRQGPDQGPQYRSTVFPEDPRQERIARAYIAQLDRARSFPRPLVTTIEAGRRFYPAESYHQDYLTRHPDNPYIVANDMPKLDELKRMFPERYRAAPALVGGPA